MKTISMHPLVRGITPSQWAKFCDARRSYENQRAIREFERSKKPRECGGPHRLFCHCLRPL